MSLYIFKEGQQLGPYDDEAILQSLRNGAFTPADLASRDAQGDWRPLSFYFPLPEHQAQQEAKTEIFQTGQAQNRDTDPFQHYQPPPAAPLAQYQPPTLQASSNNQSSGLAISLSMASLGLGIASLCFMLLGLVPCLGWLNWFTLALGFGALVTGVIVLTQQPKDGMKNDSSMAIPGLVIASLTLIIGGIRLVLGGGCL